ncbi:MAG: amidohydrolase, partial [Woeseiaceae bacterium]
MLKRINSLVTISVVVLLFAACGRESGDAAKRKAAIEAADFVLRGGKVVTVDPAIGTQQALAVNGYEIAAVGSNED